jgi:hypothetical protein
MTSPPETGQKKQGRRRGQFQPGESGNPKGKPKGARARVTIAFQALVDGQGTALIKHAIDMALKGDATIMRALLAILIPVRRDPADVKLPAVKTAADALEASSAIVAAVAEGRLTAAEGDAMSDTIKRHADLVSVASLEQRVEALERGRR